MGKLTRFSEDILLRGLEPSSHLIETIQTSPFTLVKKMLRGLDLPWAIVIVSMLLLKR